MSEAALKKAELINAITHIIVFDVETTGPNVLRNWMPEFAGAYWRIGDRAPTETFYRGLLQPPATEWDATTLAEFWNHPDHGFDGMTPLEALLKRQSANVPLADPVQAMKDFAQWVQQLDAAKSSDEEIILVSDTTGFDAQWLAVYLARAGLPGPELLFGEYRPLRDTNSLFFGIAKTIDKWGSERAALAALNIDKMPDWVQQYAHNHDPLSDANSIAASASFLLTEAARITAAERQQQKQQEQQQQQQQQEQQEQQEQQQATEVV